jgi:dipeptidyl-peptidase-4
VRVCRASGKPLFLLIENAMPKLAGRVLAKWESIAFKTSDGVELQAVLMKPPHFDPKKKYPVILHTYGGPGSQITKDAFESGGGLERYLAEKGFVFAAVDGRGTGGRGRDFMKKVYLQLGQWEVHDQIEAAQWLAKQPFVDSKHIGIWGWSYGGYMASLCILRGAEVFRAAVAVAPVTHWELYDTIYTERYMRRPHDNPKGYRETTPLREIGKLKGHFLLVHGLADDNVHFQNSARLAAELQKQEKPFRAMFYPGKGHGLEGMSKHLFTMISDFFLTTLKPAG